MAKTTKIIKKILSECVDPIKLTALETREKKRQKDQKIKLPLCRVESAIKQSNRAITTTSNKK